MRIADNRLWSFCWARGPCCVVLVALLSVAPVPAAMAQDDIAWFRLKDISGQFEVRYRLDENRNDAEHSSTFVRTPTLEEELLIRTQSYIYHPALLNISLSPEVIVARRVRRHPACASCRMVSADRACEGWPPGYGRHRS